MVEFPVSHMEGFTSLWIDPGILEHRVRNSGPVASWLLVRVRRKDLGKGVTHLYLPIEGP